MKAAICSCRAAFWAWSRTVNQRVIPASAASEPATQATTRAAIGCGIRKTTGMNATAAPSR